MMFLLLANLCAQTEKVASLKDFPELGYRLQGYKQNIRVLLFGHYRIAYKIKHNNDITILGVFHGAMKIKNYL